MERTVETAQDRLVSILDTIRQANAQTTLAGRICGNLNATCSSYYTSAHVALRTFA